MNQIKEPVSNLTVSFQNAHGIIPYGMTNDYMFRAVLQSNNKVLKGLLCSLLHLAESEVYSVEITNPILLGDAIQEKEFRLDIHASLRLISYRALPGNKPIQQWELPQRRINLEMQVANRLNWQNRSILYLCRSFDNLGHGQTYSDVEPAIHIGFLNYTLFKEEPEFYATYKLINMKNHNIYSDNFVLSVVDLTQIDLATDEDKKYHIDSWARFFKATTWKEIIMLASTNEYFNEAADSLYQFNVDERIRKRCLERREYYQDIRNYERANAKLAAENKQMEAFIAQQGLSLAEKDISLAEKDADISNKNILIQELIAENERLRAQLGQ